MTSRCDLREFMQIIIGFSTVRLRSPRVVNDLSQCSKLKTDEVYGYLENLDIKYIRVDWSGGGRVRGITEILRYDLDDLVEPKPAKQEGAGSAKPRSPRQSVLPNPRECITCHQVKRIVGQNLCKKCYNSRRYLKMPPRVRLCPSCNLAPSGNTRIRNGKCADCRSKPRICAVCGNEKVLLAKGKCSRCYQRTKEPILIHNPT